MSEFQELATANSTGSMFPQETGLESGGGLTSLGTNRSPEGTASTLEEQSAFLNLEGVEKTQYQPATVIPFAQLNEVSATDPNSAVGEGSQDWLTGGTETVPLVGTVQFFGSASGSGSGYGDQGSIDGDDAFGWGNSSGYGYGSSGTEAQFGSGYGSGYGSSGSNPGSGYGAGYGSGYGSSGFGYGSPDSGSGYGTGYGSGSGYGTGYGFNSGSGYGTGYGSGYGTGYGTGYGSGGSDNGSGSDGQPPIEPLPFLKTSGDAPAPIITWNQQTSSKPKEFLDSKGNAYIARLDYNGAGQSYTLSKYDKSGNQLWSRTTDTSSVNWYEEAYWQKGASFALDSDDNLYAFGQASLFAADFQSTSASKYALVKYDSNGNPIWHHAMDADGYPSFRLVINQERIYVAGTSAERYYGSFRYKTFLAAYDVAGNQLGKQQFDSYTLRHVDSLRGVIEYYGWSVGDSVSADVRFSNLTFDEQSNAYVIASTDPTVEPGSVAGDTEALIAKIDSNGNLIWKQQFGIITPNPDPQFDIYPIPHSDFPHDISVDKQGNIYIGGTSYGGGYSVTNPGGVTGFIAKFDGEGNQQWLQQLGSKDSGYYYGQGRYKMSFDGYNELLIVGDADTLVGKNQYGSLVYENRILVAKYDTEGNQLWAYNLKGSDVTEFSPDQKQGYLISGYDYPNGWTVTIPDRLSLVLEQSLTQVSVEDAGAIASQLPLLAQISSRLLNPQGFVSEVTYNLLRQQLDVLWGGLFSRLEQIHTVASDILATAQQFQAFLSTAGQSFEQLAFVTKLLYGISRIPELADNLDNLAFINAFVDLGKTYAAVQTDTNAPKSPFDFLFDIWRAKSEADLGIAAEDFRTLTQAEGFYRLISNLYSEPFTRFSLPPLPRSFSISGQNVDGLIQALQRSEYSHKLLDSYNIWIAYPSEENPTQKLVLINTKDNSESYNDDHSQTGEAYPYVLVVRDSQLIYYPQGVDYSLYPGDHLLLPKPGTSDLPLSLIESYLADQVIKPLLAVDKTIGQFIQGAVYQFSVDQSEAFRTLISLDPDVQQWLDQAEQGAEQTVLPNTVAFQAGRLFGDGAAIVAGILEILAGISIGGGGTGAGGLLALTGGGTVPGAALAAVSVAVGSGLVVQGTNSVAAGLEGILERTGILLAIIEGGGEESSNDVLRDVERRRVQSDFDSRIRQAEAEGYQGLADDIRYDRYRYEKEFEGEAPLSQERWLELTNRLRENRRRGLESEQAVLDEIGVQNNNRSSGGDRVSYDEKPYGVTIPDGVTNGAWIDVKSIERNSTVSGDFDQIFVQYDTAQMQVQRRGAMQDNGKDHVVILTGDESSRLRPSAPLAQRSTVLHFDQSSRIWRVWDISSGNWSQQTLSIDEVRESLGTIAPP